MAQYHTVPDSKKMVTCPFNPSHNIEEGRMPYHLIKCGKNYPDLKVETCPYNSRHMFTKQHEFEHHMARCDDRVFLEREMYTTVDDEDDSRGEAEEDGDNVPPRHIESSEDWDAEASNSRSAGYDPREKLAKLELKNPVVLANRKPAEKKYFHKTVALENENQEDEVRVRQPSRVVLENVTLSGDMESMRLPVAKPDMIREKDEVLKSRSGIGGGRPILSEKDKNEGKIMLASIARGRGTSATVKPPPGFGGL